jgi:hypothetical protein
MLRYQEEYQIKGDNDGLFLESNKAKNREEVSRLR